MRLSSWASRTAAIALLILALIAFQFFVGQPLINSFIAHRESIAGSEAMLRKYQELNASRGEVSSKLRRLKEAQENEGRLLTGDNAQLVGAKLQNRLKEVLDANNANLGSMQLLAVREEEGFQRVSMAVAFKASIDSLQSILYEIENQSPYFFVEKLELRRDRGFVQRVTDTAKENELQIRLEFYGYMLSELG
jgi:hypothetical protein